MDTRDPKQRPLIRIVTLTYETVLLNGFQQEIVEETILRGLTPKFEVVKDHISPDGEITPSVRLVFPEKNRQFLVVDRREADTSPTGVIEITELRENEPRQAPHYVTTMQEGLDIVCAILWSTPSALSP